MSETREPWGWWIAGGCAAYVICVVAAVGCGVPESGVPGCGPGTACEAVLQSRFAQLGTFPVTRGALLVAILLAAAAMPIREGLEPWQYRIRPWARRALAAVLVIGAVVFTALQFRLGAFCVWCLLAHAVAVGLAVLVGVQDGLRGRSESHAS